MKKQDVIDLAYAEEEYVEKAKKYLDKLGPEILYDKTNFAGSDNLTKYAYELNQAGLGHPNGQAWCQTFIAWIYWKSYGPELADKLLCGKLRSASTMEVKNAFPKGQFIPLEDAEPSDIVYRPRTGGGHVELVVGRSSTGQLITVGGNTSPLDKTSWNGGQVARHIGAPWTWCVRPDYSILDAYPGWHWIQYDGDWFYQDYYGNNWHGWLKVKESAGDFYHWYWFDKRGIMATGAAEIDGKWYFFQPDGPLEGACCITDESGALKIWNLNE